MRECKFFRKKRLLFLFAGLLLGLVLCRGFLALLPYPELDAFLKRPYSLVVTDRYGIPLRVTPLGNGTKREWVALNTIPSTVVRVFVRSEDSRFYFHPGIDPIAVVRSFARNLGARRTVSGASTITMQLARLITQRPRNFAGKAAEALDALRLEARLSKTRILELWLNNIPFGSNVEGLASIARLRWGLSVEALDDRRAVLLAVIPRRPDLYDPAKDESAAVKSALELSRRLKLGLSAEDLRAAATEVPPQQPFLAPHFVNRLLSEKLPPEPWTRPVKSTLDWGLQNYAEGLLSSELDALKKQRVTTGALFALDNATGAVRVYIGSRSWFDTAGGGQIDGVQVRNQSGSCLKPFLYAMALDHGFLPNDILPDLPTVFGGTEAYIPMNFNQRFNGPVRLRVALASSLNVPAVYTLERLGVRDFEEYLVSLGFESIESTLGKHGTGLALGNGEIQLDELTRAFSAFPRRGSIPDLVFLESDAANTQPSRNIMSVYAAWTIANVLSDRASRFAGFGPAPTFDTPFPAMFKTGTANQFQNIWALGATNRYTVGAWMGNFSGETIIGKTGSSIPAKIVVELLTALEGDAKALPVAGPPPPNTVEVDICSLSGMAATDRCSGTVREWLPSDRLPKPCTWHGDASSNNGTPRYPSEYRPWIVERSRSGLWDASAGSAEASIRRPAAGAIFYYDPALPPEAQGLRLEAIGFSSSARVYVNDLPAGTLNKAGVCVVPLVKGKLRLSVQDDTGKRASTWCEVR